MRRIGLAVVLAIGLALAPLSGEAQQAAKIAQIGYLSYSRAAAPDLQEAFRQGLREFGYVEGPNVVVEYRDAEGKSERLPALAAELAFKMKQQFVDGDYAYILWTAETADNVYEVGTDTFVVRNGKIVAQSFAGKITPKG
jgi:hypothetical protein